MSLPSRCTTIAAIAIIIGAAFVTHFANIGAGCAVTTAIDYRPLHRIWTESDDPGDVAL